MGLLKANFPLQREVAFEEKKENATADYEKRAKESIGGSMVFVERKRLIYDPQKESGK